MGRTPRAVVTVLVLAPLALVVTALAWRYDVVYVHGGSMEPALSGGDIVVVDPHRSVHPGDIVLFTQPGHSPVLHRAIRRRSGGWETKGDANPIADRSRAPDSWIDGAVVATLPLGDVVSRWQPAAACATLSAQPNSKRH